MPYPSSIVQSILFYLQPHESFSDCLYLVAEQTRGLVTYIASRQPDMTPDILNDILDHTFQEAKKKLIRRSPELEELIKEVKSWIIEEERAPWKNGKGKP
jgi:hypothetical protein